MACKHERLKSVNCVIYCADCGVQLPVDYLVGKDRIAEQKAAETPVKAEKKAETPKKTTTRKKAK